MKRYIVRRADPMDSWEWSVIDRTTATPSGPLRHPRGSPRPRREENRRLEAAA